MWWAHAWLERPCFPYHHPSVPSVHCLTRREAGIERILSTPQLETTAQQRSATLVWVSALQPSTESSDWQTHCGRQILTTMQVTAIGQMRASRATIWQQGGLLHFICCQPDAFSRWLESSNNLEIFNIMDWFPIVFITFKVLVLGIGMLFAIKWHYDKAKKENGAEKPRAVQISGAKVAAIFVLALLIILLLTYSVSKMLGLDLTIT